MTIRVNLIHSKLVFFLKNTKTKHTEQCNSLALFTCTVQFTCTVHATVQVICTVCAHSASELHCACKHRILQSSYYLLCKIHVQKREIKWEPLKLNCIFNGTKHYICCDCFKHRSNHANKLLLNLFFSILKYPPNL